MITAASGVLRISRHISVTIIAIALGGIATYANAWRGDEIAPWQGTDVQGVECSGLQIPFGPFDYLNRDNLQAQLNVVEETHFSKNIENLERGQTGSAIADIHYTLMAWPNHHRALQSALKYRLAHRGKWPQNSGASPAECYLQRAIKFSPRDPLPKILFGLFMHKMKQYKVAADAYREALKILPNDIMTKYNLGLALVELKQYQEAEAIAEEVYAAKYPLPGLKNKLAAPRAKLTSDKPESPNPAKEKPDATTTAAANPAASDDNTAANTVETPTDAGEASGQQTSTDTTKPGSTDAAAAPDEAKATASNDKPPEFTAEQLEQLKKAMREQAMLETEAASEPVSEPILVP